MKFKSKICCLTLLIFNVALIIEGHCKVILPSVSYTIEETIVFNSDNDQYCLAMTVDTQDNIYLTGSKNSSHEIYIMKYNESLVQEFNINWRRFPRQEATDIVTDLGGNIFLVGEVWGGSGLNYFRNLILIKFNSTGMEQWNQTWSWRENWSIDAEGITLDRFGNIYVCGAMRNESETNNLETRGFLIKFNSSGTELWNKTFGNSDSNNYVHDVKTDYAGIVYIVGAINRPEISRWEGFVWKFNYTGLQMDSLNITDQDYNFKILRISDYQYDDFLISGEISHGNLASDLLLAKYNGTGLEWNSTWGGSDTELGNGGIVVDTSEYLIHVAGSTKSYGKGDYDFFICGFHPYNGDRIGFNTFGFNSTDFVSEIAINSFNKIFLAGSIRNSQGIYNICLVKYEMRVSYPAFMLMDPFLLLIILIFVGVVITISLIRAILKRD